MNSRESIPSHETIRGWMQRVGLGRIRLAKTEDGGTWLVDHTNQIGPEKVLTVLRVRSAPSDGEGVYRKKSAPSPPQSAMLLVRTPLWGRGLG